MYHAFVPELLEAQKIMHRLPGDAGERHLADEMENDDVAALRHERARIVDVADQPTTVRRGR